MGVSRVMATNFGSDDASSIVFRERISYIKQMLGELAHVARAEKEDMLVYLLEMAYTEAGDLLIKGSSRPKVNRHHAAHMPMQPASKV